jgi:molybdopterin converting factor small subunit
MVKVEFASHLAKALETRETQVEAATVRQLLKALSKAYGEPFDLRIGVCKVIVNGTSVAFLKGKGTRLQDGDRVTVLPPVGGG